MLAALLAAQLAAILADRFLQGTATTLSALTLPALLTLPTARNARTTLTALTTRTKALARTLRYVTTVSLVSAFCLSPARVRHPYLLYTAVFAGASGRAIEWAVGGGGRRRRDGSAASDDGGTAAATAADEDADLNGELVRIEVERLQIVEGVRAAVAGVAFMMGVVGIWGDRA